MLSDEDQDGGAEAGVAVSGSGRGRGGFAAGMVFIVLAIGLNFVLDSFTPDDVAELPWFIALAFESGGKLGVTVVLCAIGVGFILWDLMIKADAKTDPKASFSAAARHGATRLTTPVPKPAGPAQPPTGEEVFAEEIPEVEESGPRKIPALKTGFSAGRTTGGPVGDANPGPPPAEGGGAMVLSTAKYLSMTGDGDLADGGGGGSGTSGASGFKRGRTNHTTSE